MKDKIHETSPEEVIVKEGRHRKHFDKGASVRLQCSIRRYGQFNPIVCTKDKEGRVVLIQGERRLRACSDENLPVKYILLEEIEDPLLLEELELEENIQREDLTWQEEVDAKERLHSIKQKRAGSNGHTMQDTADAFGESKGLISQDVELALWAKALPEVRGARNKTEAKKIIKRLKETVKRSDLLEEILTKEKEKEEPPAEDGKEVLEKMLTRFTKRSLLGPFEEKILSFPEESFDVVIFDPPWGVSLDSVYLHRTTKSFSDDPEEIFPQLKQWLEVLYERMSADSHLYLFFGLRNHSPIYGLLENQGFVTNKMPILWRKKGAHRVRTPELWPGRCYEAIAYARKGDKKLSILGRPDWIETPAPSPSMKKSHPSAKHPSVYVDLLERSCVPGDRALDPMSGSNMFGVACEYLNPTHKIDWRAIEKDKDFYELGLFNLMEGFGKITSSSKEAKEPEAGPEKKYEAWGAELEEGMEKKLEGGFQSLKPGTEEWKAYWKSHPKEQDEMLAWKAGLSQGKEDRE